MELAKADHAVAHNGKMNFPSVQYNGRKVYLCGFMHGGGVYRPGKVPIAATRHLFATDSPFVLIEGKKTQRKAARMLKHEQLSEGEDIEHTLSKVLESPSTRRELKRLFGFNYLMHEKAMDAAVALVSPFLYLRKDSNRFRNEIYQALPPRALQELAMYMLHYARIAFVDPKVPQHKKLDFFVEHFRSFLMADAIKQRHSVIPKEIPFALFMGSNHAPQVHAFLENPALFKIFERKLPRPLLKIVNAVRCINRRTMKAYSAESSVHSGLRMSKRVAAVLGE